MIVARRIVDDIRKRDLHIGDKLPPEHVMLEEYQIGRGTLREALRFLELQGVISLKPGPGGGPTIEKPDASHLATTLRLMLQFEGANFSAVVEARRSLEPLMARLAAERITQENLLRLEDSLEGMRRGVADEDVFLDMNWRFHDIVAWSSGNAIFGLLVDALVGIIEGAALGVEYPQHRRSAALKAHTEIFEALKARDGDASFAAMEAHIEEYVRYITRKFPDVLARPITWSSD